MRARPPPRCARAAGAAPFASPARKRSWAGCASGDVPALSALASLAAIGATLTEDRILDTRDHMRPAFLDGALQLMVVPAVGGAVIPHDRPRAHECGSCGQ